MPEHALLHINLGQHGWCVLKLDDMIREVTLIPTFAFSNPLERLIDLADCLLDDQLPASALFDDEPGTDAFEILIDEDTQRPVLKVLHSDTLFEPLDRLEEVARFPIAPRFFVDQIIAEFTKIEILMSNKIYQKDRSEMPWAAYRNLKEKWERRLENSSLNKGKKSDG